MPSPRLRHRRSVLAVANNVKANSVAELISYSRSVPQKMNYASAGIGSVSHLTFEVLKTATGMEAVHVPYKGGGPAMNDVIAGHVALNMAAIQVAKGLIDSGKIKGLAVTGSERSPVLPNVPTLREAGVKAVDVDLGFWFGIFGPKGMPDAVKAKLEKAVRPLSANPDRSDAACQARYRAEALRRQRLEDQARERDHQLDQVHRRARHQGGMKRCKSNRGRA